MVIELSAGKVKLTYIMPARKVILFSILPAECHYDTGNTDTEVGKCTIEGNEFGIISISIDGVRLQNLKRYRYNLTSLIEQYQRITFMTQTLYI
jgi:hypothetical protein